MGDPIADVSTWNSPNIRYLGVWLAPTFQSAYLKSIEGIIEKVRGTLASWKHLNVEEDQKVWALNWQMQLHVLYFTRAFAASLQREHAAELQKLASSFIWGGARPRVAWNMLTQPRQRVGLAIPDLDRYVSVSQLAIWAELKRSCHNPLWKQMINESSEGVLLSDWLDPPLPRAYFPAWILSLVTRVLNTISELLKQRQWRDWQEDISPIGVAQDSASQDS